MQTEQNTLKTATEIEFGATLENLEQLAAADDDNIELLSRPFEEIQAYLAGAKVVLTPEVLAKSRARMREQGIKPL